DREAQGHICLSLLVLRMEELERRWRCPGRWWWRCCAASSPLPPLELHLRVSYAEPEYARWMLSRSPSSVVHPPPGAATAGEHLASAGIALSSKMSAMPCLAGEKRKRDGG
uniref:Uncharacterized protein n=1 Tax=Oryza glaberrima TaxID=4538 RepID=I1PT05_ORYGL